MIQQFLTSIKNYFFKTPENTQTVIDTLKDSLTEGIKLIKYNPVGLDITDFKLILNILEKYKDSPKNKYISLLETIIDTFREIKNTDIIPSNYNRLQTLKNQLNNFKTSEYLTENDLEFFNKNKVDKLTRKIKIIKQPPQPVGNTEQQPVGNTEQQQIDLELEEQLDEFNKLYNNIVETQPEPIPSSEGGASKSDDETKIEPAPAPTTSPIETKIEPAPAPAPAPAPTTSPVETKIEPAPAPAPAPATPTPEGGASKSDDETKIEPTPAPATPTPTKGATPTPTPTAIHPKLEKDISDKLIENGFDKNDIQKTATKTLLNDYAKRVINNINNPTFKGSYKLFNTLKKETDIPEYSNTSKQNLKKVFTISGLQKISSLIGVDIN